MLLKFHAASFLLLLAIPVLSSAQPPVPESTCPTPNDLQGQGAADLDASERSCLQALQIAIKAQSDERPAVYRIYLSLASLHEGRHQYAEAEKHYQLAYNVAKTL